MLKLPNNLWFNNSYNSDNSMHKQVFWKSDAKYNHYVIALFTINGYSYFFTVHANCYMSDIHVHNHEKSYICMYRLTVCTKKFECVENCLNLKDSKR